MFSDRLHNRYMYPMLEDRARLLKGDGVEDVISRESSRRINTVDFRGLKIENGIWNGELLRAESFRERDKAGLKRAEYEISDRNTDI